MTRAHDKGMEDVFWDGVNGVGGWDQRSRDPPDDIFVCIGAEFCVSFLSTESELNITGANDKALGADKDEFLQHYQAFLVRLRDSYPGTLKRIHVIVSATFWA